MTMRFVSVYHFYRAYAWLNPYSYIQLAEVRILSSINSNQSREIREVEVLYTCRYILY